MDKQNVQIFYWSGFTLIELLVTLVLLTLIATIAMPSLAEVIRSNQLTAQTNSLVTALHVARSEAVKRRVQVSVCKRKLKTAPEAPEKCADSAWRDGWLVFTGSATPGTTISADALLRVQEPLAAGYTLRSDGFEHILSFDPSGRTSDDKAGSFRVCDKEQSTNRGRRVDVSRTGRIASQRGLGKDDEGDEVTC